MKLYSILLFQKSAVGQKPKLLKDAYDLKDFSFFQKGSVKEFMDFTGRLLVERAATPSRTSIKEQEYFIHCYVRQDNLTGVCITDGEYEARVAFTMLSKVMEDFTNTIHPSQWDAIQNAASCNYSKLPELLAKWQNPREADSLTRVQDEIEETKVVLHNTIASVLERGEKLDDLVKASENLSEQSKMFYTQARKMNKCCSWA
uniref:Synaptobrevin homolog YKT6 n=1 Tax=Panagrolaimus sp. ES5 TaxID=591445 RepID=A0AC34FKR5_9BILA